MSTARPARFNFSFLCVGQLVTQFGDSVFHIGLLWLALELTGSKSISGIIVAAGFLPAILLSLFAGVVVDRVDRRKLMIFCALLQAVVVACVPLLNHFNLLSGLFMALVAFGLATGAAFFNPARDSLVPHLVPADRLNRANSLVQVSAQIAFLAGPAAAGVLVSIVGTIGLFTIDAGTFLFSAVTLMLINMPRTTSARLETSPSPLPQIPPATGGTIAEIKDGLHKAMGDPRLRGLLFITAVDNLIIMGPAMLGVPIYVRDILKLNVDSYSLIVGAFFIGMIISSLIIGAKGRNWPKGKLIVIGMILDGITFIPFFFIRDFSIACLAMFIHGLTVPLITVPRTTLIHEIVPDDLRGRIFALVNVAVVGFTALSMVLTGFVCDWLAGIDEIYLWIGILGAICGIFGTRFKAFWNA